MELGVQAGIGREERMGEAAGGNQGAGPPKKVKFLGGTLRRLRDSVPAAAKRQRRKAPASLPSRAGPRRSSAC